MDLVARVVEAFNRRDVAGLIEMATADIEFDTLTGNAVTSTVYRGHAGLRDYFRDVASTWTEMRFAVQELRDLGDRGVLLLAALSAIGSASGAEVHMSFASLFELHCAKVRRMQTFSDRESALSAFGS